MNTVKIGDKFEDKCFNLIKEAIHDGKLGISEVSAKVYRKKGYYSKDREKDIIFDLSIEVWPKNAGRYVLVFFIECKSYSSKNIPVDDVEEFYTKINQVAGSNHKGIMISDTSFQKGGITFAKNKGIMMIEVNPDNNYSIVLHRTNKETEKNINDKLSSAISNFLVQTLGFKKILGLKKLSAQIIEEEAESILLNFNNLRHPLTIEPFIKFLEQEYKLEFDFSKNLESINGKRIEGYFNIDKNRILIDKSIQNTAMFPFLLGHEIGHFFLHKNLKLNQKVYNSFDDSEFDPFLNKHKFTNDKHWIEWQANKFSVGLFLPKVLFKKEVIKIRKELGIRNPQRIYLDDQVVNQQDFYKTVTHLSEYFGTSKTSVRYRIEDLKLIEYDESGKKIGDIVRNLIF